MLLTNYEYANASTSVALKDSGADTYLAQGVKVNRTSNVGMIYIYLTPTGAPGGYLYVELQDSANGVVENGTSEGIPVTSLVDGWNAFMFDLDARPVISNETQHYIALKHSGYTYGASDNVVWSCDQATPHYIRGVGKTYNGAVWSALGSDTDFIFRIYSGHRVTIYSRLNEVEALTKNLTKLGRYTDTSMLTVSSVMDFEDAVAGMIDGWLIGAGITAPLTDDVAKDMIRSYANQCVALECEMTQNTAGFTTESSRTRAGSFKLMCDVLMKDLAKGGNITDALLETEDGVQIGGGDGLTAGMIEDSDRDDRDDDTTLIQPTFKNDMFDRP
jgi:hypothetical protein